MQDRKKVQNNLLVGIAGQAVAVLLGIILPRLVLGQYGSEVNGLLSSVTNIYAYIAIVEAGVAAASCQALYKPLSEKDYSRANAVIAACHRQYRRIGSVYIALVVLFSVVYPLLIATEVPFVSVVLIILFNGIGNAVNFFFHGKYLILLRADGKQYVRAGLDMASLMARQVGKIVLIQAGCDVVVVQVASMLVSIGQMLWLTRYAKKHYAWVDVQAKPDYSSLVQSKHVLAHEVNYLITSNLDTVLLTFFTNLKTVSVYSLYTLLYGMITRVLQAVRDALEFKIAYEYHRSKEAFLKLFEAYEVCYITFATALISIVSYFILPFMAQYTAGITDVNYLDSALPPLFALVFLFAAGRYPSDALIHISGHFRETKKSAVAETIINLVVSIVLVNFWGISGALLGTIASSLFRTVYLIQYVNRELIGRGTGKTYLCWGVNLALLVGAGGLGRLMTPALDSYVRIFLFCVPYSIATFILFFGVMTLVMPETMKNALGLLKSIRRRG